jgi:hypothetical protein
MVLRDLGNLILIFIIIYIIFIFGKD